MAKKKPEPKLTRLYVVVSDRGDVGNLYELMPAQAEQIRAMGKSSLLRKHNMINSFGVKPLPFDLL